MKTNTIILFLTILVLPAYAQVPDGVYNLYISKNPDGTTEFLKMRGVEISYSSSLNRQEIRLKIQYIRTENGDSLFVTLQFPNDHKIYKLYNSNVGFFSFRCVNPDGTSQIFALDTNLWGNRGLYKCENPNGSTEYLSLSHTDYYYYSSWNKNKIRLTATNVDSQPVCGGYLIACELFFPQETKGYKCTFSVEGKYDIPYIICESPTGEKQKFVWIGKF